MAIEIPPNQQRWLRGLDAKESYKDAGLATTEALQAFDDGASVDTPDGFGIIDDIITEGSVDDMDASDDDPVYAVVVEDESVGVGFYRESDLSDASVDDLPGPDDATSELEAMADIHNATGDTEALQDGFFEWPESWEDSPQPARVIALKAWAGMGGSFTGCTREMRGSLTGSPDRFCADFKDRLYGTEQWRGGWGNEALAGQSGTAALGWNPSLHPRDDQGKFTERGGVVSDVVDAVESAIEAGDRAAVESAIEDNTSLTNASFTNLRPEQMPDVARELAGLDEQGELENVDSFQTSLPDGVDSNAIGHYGRENRELSIKGDIATQERLSALEEDGFLAGGSVEHLIRHETGHAQHFQAIRDSDPEIPPQAEFDDATQELITEEVGSYAAENGLELVAEVYAIKTGGGEVPEEIEEIYEQVGGSEVSA